MGSRWMPRITRPGGGGGGGGGGDRFAPTFLVGNVNEGDPATSQSGPFTYIPDPGDGSGIKQALDLASSSFAGATVHIRRGMYGVWSSDPSLFPLVVPEGVVVRGDGVGPYLNSGTIISGPMSVTQCVLVLEDGAVLEDLAVVAPEINGEITDTMSPGVVWCTGHATLNRVRVDNYKNWGFNPYLKVQHACVWCDKNHPTIRDSRFLGYDRVDPGEGPSVGILIGHGSDETGGMIRADRDGLISNVRIDANVGIMYRDIYGGMVSGLNVNVIGRMQPGQPTAGIWYRQKSYALGATDHNRLPQIDNVRVLLTTTEADSADGILIELDPEGIDRDFAEPIRRLAISDVYVERSSVDSLETAGARIVARARVEDAGAIADVLMTNVSTHNTHHGLRVIAEASDQVGRVAKVRVTNFSMGWYENSERGISLEPGGDGAGSIDNVGIVNCALSGHDIGQTAVYIGNGTSRTSIGFCALNGDGTPIDDNGALTDAANNQMS